MSRLRYARLQRRADGQELPADASAVARSRPPANRQHAAAPAGPEAELMRLQHTAGNRAVASLVASVQTLKLPFSSRSAKGKAKPQAGAATKAKVLPGDLPSKPSIAVSASGVAQGGSFGGHAMIYLAVPFGGDMEYMFIDLVMDREAGKKAIDIRIKDLNGGWPGPSTSTTWSITPEGANKAWVKAKFFQLQKRKYSYSYLGIGYRQYNCAVFAEKILEAAGVKRSAGLLVSTPLEVALGKKLPSLRKKERKKSGPAPVPAQYDI